MANPKQVESTMQTIDHAVFPDEAPTRAAPAVPSSTRAFAARAERLTDRALDLLRAGDDDAVNTACVTLVQLQALCSGVGR
jgi:hypothetical protein